MNKYTYQKLTPSQCRTVESVLHYGRVSCLTVLGATTSMLVFPTVFGLIDDNHTINALWLGWWVSGFGALLATCFAYVVVDLPLGKTIAIAESLWFGYDGKGPDGDEGAGSEDDQLVVMQGGTKHSSSTFSKVSITFLVLALLCITTGFSYISTFLVEKFIVSDTSNIEKTNDGFKETDKAYNDQVAFYNDQITRAEKTESERVKKAKEEGHAAIKAAIKTGAFDKWLSDFDNHMTLAKRESRKKKTRYKSLVIWYEGIERARKDSTQKVTDAYAVVKIAKADKREYTTTGRREIKDTKDKLLDGAAAADEAEANSATAIRYTILFLDFGSFALIIVFTICLGIWRHDHGQYVALKPDAAQLLLLIRAIEFSKNMINGFEKLLAFLSILLSMALGSFANLILKPFGTSLDELTIEKTAVASTTSIDEISRQEMLAAAGVARLEKAMSDASDKLVDGNSDSRQPSKGVGESRGASGKALSDGALRPVKIKYVDFRKDVDRIQKKYKRLSARGDVDGIRQLINDNDSGVAWLRGLGFVCLENTAVGKISIKSPS